MFMYTFHGDLETYVVSMLHRFQYCIGSTLSTVYIIISISDMYTYIYRYTFFIFYPDVADAMSIHA